MSEDKFKPEEDFEKENLYLIKNLAKIKENISDDFEYKLFNRLKNSSRAKRISYWDLLLDKYRNTRMPMYLSYACLIAGLFTAGYFFLLNRTTENKEAHIITENKMNPIPKITIKDSSNEINNNVSLNKEKYLVKIKEMVMNNMSYGFFIDTSLQEIKIIMNSKEFKEKISTYKKPGIDDSVKVIIDIMKNN